MPESSWEVATLLGFYMLVTAIVSFVGPWLAMAFAFLWLTGVTVTFLIRDPHESD